MFARLSCVASQLTDFLSLWCHKAAIYRHVRDLGLLIPISLTWYLRLHENHSDWEKGEGNEIFIFERVLESKEEKKWNHLWTTSGNSVECWSDKQNVVHRIRLSSMGRLYMKQHRYLRNLRSQTRQKLLSKVLFLVVHERIKHK